MLHAVGNKYTTESGLIGLLTTFQLKGKDFVMLTGIGDIHDLSYKGYNGNRIIDPVEVDNPYNVPDKVIDIIAGKGWQAGAPAVTI